MYNNRSKKGFTIVELVIVIAVIAILAAISIPTFSTLISKSKQSNDTQLVKRLNTALAVDNNRYGGTHPTMQSALDAAADAGYYVEKINASDTDNVIVWDQENDAFGYLVDGVVSYYGVDATQPTENWKLWVISGEVSDTYSTYYTGSQTSVTTSKGFDAGKSAVRSLRYEKGSDVKNDVILRTNGGNLEVDADTDTVRHYGDADVVNVIAVADACYHEYGQIAVLKFARGKFIAEALSRVSTLYVTGNATKIEIKAMADVDLYAKAEGVSPMEFLVADTDKSAEVAEKTESQIAVFEAAAGRYAGGNGSVAYPFLISKPEHIDVSMREDVAAGGYVYSYKLISDIDLGDNFVPLGALSYIVNGPGSVSVDISSTKAFLGNFDGQGHTIKMKQRGDLACLFYSIGNYDTYFKDVVLDVDLHSTRNACALAIQTTTYANRSLTIEHVTVRGNIVGETGAAGLLMTFLNSNGATGVMRNCTNYANITTKKFNGSNYVFCCGLVGQSCNTKYNTTITFENCRNEGDLICDITDEAVLAKVNTSATAYYSIMGHIVGQVANSSYTSGSVSTMNFINCSFRPDAKIEGYSAKNGAKACFEGYDRSAGKNTYTGSANVNKQLMGGNAPTNVFVGSALASATEYVRSGSANFFAHGGASGDPGRSSSTTANYPVD